jgi:hypothetical protein
VGRLLLVAAFIAGVFGGGCGGSDEPSSDAKQIQLSPSEDSERAARASLDLSVAPRNPKPPTVIRITFPSRVRLGPTSDGRRRGYEVVARVERETVGCVENRFAIVDRGRRG